jgi:hypothetical protein
MKQKWEEDENLFGEKNTDLLDPYSYTYRELQEFLDIWTQDLNKVRKTRRFDKLAKYFTDDCMFGWRVPGFNAVYIYEYLNRNFTAVGPEAIVAAIEKDDLFCLKDWTYPVVETLIDPRKGVLTYFWEEISPYKKEDGTPYKTNCVGVTQIHYAGSYKMKMMDIQVDADYQMFLIEELVTKGIASQDLVDKFNAYEAQYAEDEKVWNAHIEQMRQMAKK